MGHNVDGSETGGGVGLSLLVVHSDLPNDAIP